MNPTTEGCLRAEVAELRATVARLEAELPPTDRRCGMNVANAKPRGRATENMLVDWLREHGWAHAERRRMRGSRDAGDVTGTPGLAWEAKSSLADLAKAVDEAQRERVNADAEFGVTVMRRRGTAYPGHWYATLPLAHLVSLLHQAGYGDCPDPQVCGCASTEAAS